MSDAGPARAAFAVVKSDTTVIPVTRALYIGTAGDLTVRVRGNAEAVVFKAATAGTILPVCVDQVRQATTAADIVALY